MQGATKSRWRTREGTDECPFSMPPDGRGQPLGISGCRNPGGPARADPHSQRGNSVSVIRGSLSGSSKRDSWALLRRSASDQQSWKSLQELLEIKPGVPSRERPQVIARTPIQLTGAPHVSSSDVIQADCDLNQSLVKRAVLTRQLLPQSFPFLVRVEVGGAIKRLDATHVSRIIGFIHGVTEQVRGSQQETIQVAAVGGGATQSSIGAARWSPPLDSPVLKSRTTPLDRQPAP